MDWKLALVLASDALRRCLVFFCGNLIYNICLQYHQCNIYGLPFSLCSSRRWVGVGIVNLIGSTVFAFVDRPVVGLLRNREQTG